MSGALDLKGHHCKQYSEISQKIRVYYTIKRETEVSYWFISFSQKRWLVNQVLSGCTQEMKDTSLLYKRLDIHQSTLLDITPENFQKKGV